MPYLLHSAVMRTKWYKGCKNPSEGSTVLQEGKSHCYHRSLQTGIPASTKLNPGPLAGRADTVVCVCASCSFITSPCLIP